MEMPKKQIIAMGGGGFSMEPDAPWLDQYILKQAGRPEPRVCFIGSASGDAPGYIESFYQNFRKHPCIPSHLSLTNPDSGDLEDFVLGQDILYVGGGSTRLMMDVWRDASFDVLIHRAWNQGIVLAGLSAGSICWFEEGYTDDEDECIEGLGFIEGSHCPHYNETVFHDGYLAAIHQGRLKAGIAAEDGVALHYVGETLQRLVSSRPNARAYVVKRAPDGVVDEKLIPHYLG